MQQLHSATIPESPADQCAQDLLAAVPLVMRFIRRQMRQHREAGLSVPQFRALIFLSVHDDASLSAMAEHLGLSLPAASRLVQLLVSRGLMERRADAGDRRRVSLSLTRHGTKAYRTALTATERALAAALNGLTPQQAGQVSTAMRLIEDVFGEQHLPDPV